MESREKEREAEEDEMASLTYSCEGERERESRSGIWCFFTLIKNRDALQWKKYDEKLSSHELKAGEGLRQTTTNEQLHSALCWRRRRKVG